MKSWYLLGYLSADQVCSWSSSCWGLSRGASKTWQFVFFNQMTHTVCPSCSASVFHFGLFLISTHGLTMSLQLLASRLWEKNIFLVGCTYGGSFSVYIHTEVFNCFFQSATQHLDYLIELLQLYFSLSLQGSIAKPVNIASGCFSVALLLDSLPRKPMLVTKIQHCLTQLDMQSTEGYKGKIRHLWKEDTRWCLSELHWLKMKEKRKGTQNWNNLKVTQLRTRQSCPK